MTEHKLSEQEMQEIIEGAKLLYPTVSPIRALQNRGQISCQAAYIAAATAERLRAKGLVEALEEIIGQKLEPGEKDYRYAFNRNWHIATEALNNYNQNKEV